MNWINTVNTTSFRIVASVCLAVIVALILIAALVFGGWEPKESQLTLLMYVGGGIFVMMGVDITQFITKRFTHSEYVAAKKGPSPVTVEAPSKVEVTSPPDSAVPAVQIERPSVTRDD